MRDFVLKVESLESQRSGYWASNYSGIDQTFYSSAFKKFEQVFETRVVVKSCFRLGSERRNVQR